MKTRAYSLIAMAIITITAAGCASTGNPSASFKTYLRTDHGPGGETTYVNQSKPIETPTQAKR